MSINNFICCSVLYLLLIACNHTKKLDIANESEVTSDSLAISNNKHNYTIGDSLIKLCLQNNTSGTISYGNNYDIELYDSISCTWNSIVFNEDIIFTLQKFNLYQGGSDTIKIHLYPNFYDYKPGKYRISKDIQIYDESSTTKIYFNFSLSY